MCGISIQLQQQARGSIYFVLCSCILDEGVESGTETEGSRTPRLTLNLQRQFISPSFAKFLDKQLVCDRLDDILTESDFRERLLPGKNF